MPDGTPTYRERFGYLPAVLTMLVETVGEDAMLKIASQLGGTRISVGPASLKKSPLPEMIGKLETELLFERARRDELLRIEIPRMGRTLELHRHMRILRLRAEGTKIAEIALRLGMTERNVYYVLAADRATPDPRQLDLPF